MSISRPYALSIAGFDPSGGAGVLADIKTFEAIKVQGFGVITGLTFQNDSEFDGVKWIEADEILKQVEVLSRKFKFEYVKIGMIENLDVLKTVIDFCRLQTVNCKLIWDPILRASAGFQVHEKIDKEKLIKVCKNIYLITPNTEEVKILMGEADEKKAAKQLSQYCNVFLKGGHSELNKGRDYLFTKEKEYSFRPKKLSDYPKHGSGCVLSAAITARLARGNKIHKACLEAKDYVTKFLISNKTLLGYHRI